ncbi:MAG: glutamate racemase [Clostridia bacterium]|nr:glutamate racemase [Clostridia bacterium]
MADNRPIGVFDSGLGGLTVVKELYSQLPNEDIVYFGDTGRVPYGPKSESTIKQYAKEDERFLLSKDVKLIIAACGTVSSVAADTADDLPVPFFGVVSYAAKSAVVATRNGKIGVIGTSATVKSGKHKECIKELMPEAEVTVCPCPLFVPLVEEGWCDKSDIVVKETVARYLEPMVSAGVDTLILGCTHYPVLSDAISDYLGESVTLINAGTAVAGAVEEYLKNNDSLNDTSLLGKHNFYVSDKPDSFRKQASILLQREIDENKVKRVNLSDL